jgi:soluble lytic murein transglycosylase-like protein
MRPFNMHFYAFSNTNLRGQKAEQMIAHLLDLPPPQGQAQVSELYEMAQRRQQKMNEWKKERALIFQRGTIHKSPSHLTHRSQSCSSAAC